MNALIFPALLLASSFTVNASDFIISGNSPEGKLFLKLDTYKDAQEIKRQWDNKSYSNVMIDQIVTTPKTSRRAAKAKTLSASLTADETVDLTERYAKSLPNDPLVLRQSYLRDYTLHYIERDGTYYGDWRGISAVEAWPLDVANENVKVRVMVIDGGFYPNDDLIYNQGINFISPQQDSTSEPDLSYHDGDYLYEEIKECDGRIDNHGLGVAGLLSATRNNAIGVSGVANNVELIAVRALDCGTGYLSNIIRGVLYGAQITDSGIIDAVIPEIDEQVNVINLSLSGRTPQCPSQLQSAINQATEKGIIVISAAGNASEDAGEYFPGNCDNVINVGGTTMANEQLWSATNTGSTVDIHAPAVTPALLSGLTQNDIQTSEGTSNSTPLVAGTIAMMKRNVPSSRYDEIKFLITQTANIMPDGNITVNAKSALANAINRNSESAGSITHGLDEGTSCKKETLVSAFNDRFNLCSKVKVRFLIDVENDPRRTFELVSLDQEEVILTTTSPTAYFDINMINPNSDYGFNVCTNGKCERSPLNFEVNITVPESCSN